MDFRARVLIVTRDDARITPLAEGLDARGWRTVTAHGVEAALMAAGDLSVEAVILDGGPEAWLDLAESLGVEVAPRLMPIMSLGVRSSHPDVALSVVGPPHPVQIALRLEQAVRAAVAQEELTLRRMTFADHGHVLDPAASVGPRRLLTVGDPDPRFLALSNALATEAVEVTAALTPYTAFDYLHERTFDAVLLWGGADPAAALSISAGMRRNTRLYHLPSLLYLARDADMNLAEAFGRGLSDVASADTPEPETAARVLALADGYRRMMNVREALERARGSGLMDGATGLFTREMFAQHLARLAHGARERSRSLSVCVLRVSDRGAVASARPGGWLDRAMPQIGAMISRLVRAEDTAGRLSAEVFALALPATAAGQAKVVAERIAAVIGCTAFDAGPEATPFVVEFDVGVAELMPGESPSQALERAARDTAQAVATA